MKDKKILPLAAAAVCLLLALCIFVGSCGKGGGATTPETGVPAGTVGTEKLTYTLVLKSEGGMPMEGVGVYFYTDSTLSELVWFAKTDAEGKASFTDLASDLYVAVLDNVPDGYKVDPSYPLTGEVTEIILSANMAEGDLSSISYKLGDVMQNFSVTGPDGTVYVLSELLAEKEAVVLNFWYLQCAPCRMEFPYLQEAYEAYSDKIALIAMNPINDDDAAIAAYQQELGLTFPMVHCDFAWEKAMGITAYPTTVIIDRYGTISLIHAGSITDSKIFEDAFAFFTSDDYEQTVVEDIMDLEIKEQGSDSENPIEIGGKTSFTVTVRPGQQVYYHLYRLDGMYLTINNADAYVVYNGTTYEPRNGTIGFTVHCPDTYTPARMFFGNSGSETITFTVTLAAPAGTFNNPYTLKLGKFTTKVSAGNDQGVYYIYKATKTGTLTVQCTSVTGDVDYDYTLLNQSTMAMRSIKEDGDVENGSVSIPMKKGQKVTLTIGTLPDSTNSYPGATFKSVATFTEGTAADDTTDGKVTYAITVTDTERNPVPAVVLKMVGENVDETLKTDAKGVASTKQAAGTYTVTLTVPTGYSAATTQFELTDANPYVSLKLDKIEIIMANYTVTVVDAEGNPISGAQVTIDSETKETDEKGQVTFELERGNYQVLVMMDGFDPVSRTFADGETEMTITLGGEEIPDNTENPENPDEPTVPVVYADYSVTVVTWAGEPKSGVTVQLLKDGVMAGAQKTDSAGKAVITAPKGSYTVSLAFSGSPMFYEKSKAVLPEGTTSLTIRVAPGVNGEYEMIYDTYQSYYLTEGATYVTMQSQVTNYFIFEPTRAGVFRFSTSDASAVLSYWGGNLSFIYDGTAATDYDPATNSFTRNVKESNLGGVIIIGITGAPECIVEITRIGDPILDETDIVPTVYEAKTPPKSFTISKTQGKKLTYVDLAGKTEDYRIVMGSDGYYHLNSADGPLLYMNIGPNAPYHSLYYMAGAGGNGVAGTGIKATVYDENGKVKEKWDFSECMLSYGECADATYGVYPLTEDLRFMVQTAGEYYGWWDSTNGNFWFGDVANLNPELGWMFAVCYVP